MAESKLELTSECEVKGNQDEPSDARRGVTVVIGMDGSEHSLYALNWYAEHCYRDTDKVILVYTVEMSEVLTASQWLNTPNPEDVDAFQTIFQSELKKIHRKMEEFGEYMRLANVRGTVKSTHATKPGEGILNVAKEMNANLIVTGSRGLGKIRRTLLGSVSDYVVHHADVPVLVCRYREKGKD